MKDKVVFLNNKAALSDYLRWLDRQEVEGKTLSEAERERALYARIYKVGKHMRFFDEVMKKGDVEPILTKDSKEISG